MKNKKGIIITKGFQEILDESRHKPIKIWVDKDSEFYNRSMKSLLQYNDIEIYLTRDKVKSVVGERFIRTLKSKIYKYMTSLSKNVYIGKLYDLLNKYGSTYHSTIKVDPVDVKETIYLLFLIKKIVKNSQNLSLVTA